MSPFRPPVILSWPLSLGFVAGICGGLVWATYEAPGLFWILGPAVAIYGFATIRMRRYWQRLGNERKTESICTFARALPARAHDTWVVRAVYEELSANRNLPLRPHDLIERDLGFLPEDFDDCLERAAFRSGRSYADCSKNPWVGKVVTISDAIAFLEHQPLLAENEKAAYP